MKIGNPSCHADLSGIQWFILVIFKGDIPQNEVNEAGD